jgi:hypothetical protein
MKEFTTKTRRRLYAFVVVLIVAVLAAVLADRFLLGRIQGGDADFEVKPYLQLGDAPSPLPAGRESLTLLWQTADPGGDDSSTWVVETRSMAGGPWNLAAVASSRRIAVEGVPPFRIYRATLIGLPAGTEVAYRVRHAGRVTFEALGRTRKPAGQPQRFVVFGDCGAGNRKQNQVAFQAYRSHPDYGVITGDVVYTRGRVSEYLHHFFTTYNHDTGSPGLGAPLLRSTLFLSAPGNHDLIERNLDKFPDGLAFYYYWALPLNGPLTTAGAASTPTLKGAADRQQAFLEATRPAYPRMANFSFDYGDVHWTILDANSYTDWTDRSLRTWLDADLAAARRSAWRIVAFHQPPFNGSKTHAEDQRMRVLAPDFEQGKVALVLSGHVHNYQRTYPLKFVPKLASANGRQTPFGLGGEVDGTWTLDKAYDSSTGKRPDGVIYVVTGAGGASLYDSKQNDDPASWQPFTARLVSNVHSLTIADVTADTMTIRQVSADGAELDRFVITR